MKLDLLYQWPEGRKWYTVGDAVRGCVVIESLPAEPIERIIVSLYGRPVFRHVWVFQEQETDMTHQGRTKIVYVGSPDELGSASRPGYSSDSAEYQVTGVPFYHVLNLKKNNSVMERLNLAETISCRFSHHPRPYF